MKKAFTLAEVLITLTIIGVIAALTIPNLMQKYQEQTTVNKVKKFYSTLSNAYAQAQKEYGTIDDSWTYDKVYEYVFKPYFKISKVCKNDFCGYSSSTKYLNGTGAWDYKSSIKIYTLILDDGSYVWIIDSVIYPEDRGRIYLIVNPQKTNRQTWGINIFSFGFIDQNVYPISVRPNDKYKTIKASEVQSYCLTANSNGSYCTPWVIYKGNMDYLHCSDLSWNGKNKCN